MRDPNNHEHHSNPFVAWVNGESKAKPEEEKKLTPTTEKRAAKSADVSVHHDRFHKAYKPLAVILCCAFIALLIFVCVKTPPFGVTEAPTNIEVAQK